MNELECICLGSFETEAEAMKHTKLVINSCVVQKQGDRWFVFQLSN